MNNKLFGVVLLGIAVLGASWTIAAAQITYPQSVPNLVGLTFDQAKAALNSRGLDIAKGGRVPTTDASLDGKVAKQSHRKGTLCMNRLTVTVDLHLLVARPSSDSVNDPKLEVPRLRR